MSIGTIITEDGEVLENVKFFTQEEQANLERHKEIMEITRKMTTYSMLHYVYWYFYSIFLITNFSPFSSLLLLQYLL